MTVSIQLLSRHNSEEILEFEKQNKAFFETIIPPRGDYYYDIENLKQILEEIEDEQNKGLCYMYLIRNEKEKLVGRVNLFSIARGIFQKAEIGYRIGKEHNGKGYATEAVKLACKEAFEKYKLHRVEAGTSNKNIGSQIVLVKNGFEFIGRTKKVIKINGKWEDGVLFEKINKNY
ncbi:MAG: GNAT family N-acetyltransferase [Maledivibacter sp.]|jgi:ribosomal-protein-alanine N-acetyltransferase|nr:GNAT family N-acetyltransferase [Maledivibacter sp.]